MVAGLWWSLLKGDLEVVVVVLGIMLVEAPLPGLGDATIVDTTVIGLEIARLEIGRTNAIGVVNEAILSGTAAAAQGTIGVGQDPAQGHHQLGGRGARAKASAEAAVGLPGKMTAALQDLSSSAGPQL